ncbi:hypothetical protein [Pseudomonas gorinensis]
MKIKLIVLSFFFSIAAFGQCIAAEHLKVSREQAAIEASFNLKIAKRLWLESRDACSTQNYPQLIQIMRAVNSQSGAQPTNHLNYSARFAFSGCLSMLSDVAFISGACLNKPPTKHEIDYVQSNWEKDSAQCVLEIDKPDFSTYEDLQGQSEEAWESEQRKAGNSEESINYMKMLRRL